MLKTPLSQDFKTAKSQVYEALEKGKFFNAIHAAADATGFRFRGMSRERIISMGETVLIEDSLRLNIKAPFPFRKKVSLVHNGKSILQSNEDNITYIPSQSGTYRVEVYLEEDTSLKKKIPWIISNPIFLRKERK